MQLHSPSRHHTSTARRLLSLARLMPALVLFGAVAVVATSHTPATRGADTTNVVAVFEVQDKPYDGTTSAVVNPGHCFLVLNNLNLDPVTDAGCDDSGATATFVSKNVGVRAATATGITLTGANAGGYTLTKTLAGGRISAVPLDISATSDTKTYDGGTTSGATPTYSALQTGDSISGLVQAFGSRNAGAGTLSVTGYVINDTNNGLNYTLTVHTASGTINPAPLDVYATSDTKVYDGGTSSAATPTAAGPLNALIAGDTLASATQAFDSKNVFGTDGSTLHVVTYTVNDGNGGHNYQAATLHTATGTITPRALHVTATGVNRLYDGTNVATVTLQDDRVSGDDLTLGYTSATFTDKHVGTSKPVSVGGISITGGADALNYSANSTAATTATIGKRPITVTASASNKTADGTTGSTALPTTPAGAIQTGDSAGFYETYDTAAAGSAKTMTPAGVVIDGNLGGDYSYSFVQSANGNIRPAPVATITFSAGPIDTQVNTPIYNTCVPTGSGNPCALSTANPGSGTVKVRAVDAYGNLAGAGAPGADGSVVDVAIQIRKGSSSGGALATVSTSGGTASFGDLLSISTVGQTRLYAVATTGYSAATAPNVTSSQILIAGQLAACQGTLCIGQSSDSGTKSWGQIVGQSNFYSPSTNVIFTTALTAGSQTTGQCGVNSTSSSTGTIGSSVEQRVSGYGIQATLPTETQVIVIPMSTLQALHIQSRDADDFSVCLGAVNLSSRTAPSTPWQAQGFGSSQHSWWDDEGRSRRLVSAVGRSDDPTDPSALYRYWGVPADCGTPGLSSTDPCIVTSTKSANQLSSALGGISVSAFFSSGDIAIVIREPYPWDGKGGVYN